MEKLGVSEPQTPELIDTKSDTGDYVTDIIPLAKIQSDRHRPSGGVAATRPR